MSLTLYAAPGACSRVPMMTLEEAGADYDVKLVRFMKGEHKRPDYLAMHPAGKVPLLMTNDGPVTQNVAIARYLAAQFDGLLPKAATAFEDAQITADLAFCADTVHPVVTRMRMPMFMVEGDEAMASVRAKAMDAMAPLAQLINTRLGKGNWWYGDAWSVMDAYVYWIWFRITGAGFSGAEFSHWAAHAAAMELRPAIQRALAKDAELQATLEAEGLAPKFK
ncbi:glutathione S-transferase [Pacificibacter maritimus]|uniref:Glutathione S-transferase n=1 Tax=Pacificibacter maritimus TaxID=762213 RepID=A0A3N4VE61_9RHOB|nr:glutathione S-transferase family protein [Pacificibacter maritimus]RPE72140.1 glutathione S-transferase [Pacificibacter maritimus]